MAGAASALEVGPLGKVSSSLNLVFRKAILSATHNRLAAKTVRRYGMRFGAARFVAGETLDEAVPILRWLNEKGLRTNTTLLGEGVRDEATARAVVAETTSAIRTGSRARRIADEHRAEADPPRARRRRGVAYQQCGRIVEHAASHGNFIRIDMEESARVDADAAHLPAASATTDTTTSAPCSSPSLPHPARPRSICCRSSLTCGWSKAPISNRRQIAYPKQGGRRPQLRRARRADARRQSGFTAIATHDERIIDHVIDFTDARRHRPRPLRVPDALRHPPAVPARSRPRGYRVLIATPYGPEWYLYLMRRLAERPANLLFLVRNLGK